MSYGQRLRELRTQLGLTVLGFAQKAKLSSALISECERDERLPSSETLEWIYQVTRDLEHYRAGIVLRLQEDWWTLAIEQELAIAMARQMTRHLEPPKTPNPALLSVQGLLSLKDLLETEKSLERVATILGIAEPTLARVCKGLAVESETIRDMEKALVQWRSS